MVFGGLLAAYLNVRGARRHVAAQGRRARQLPRRHALRHRAAVGASPSSGRRTRSSGATGARRCGRSRITLGLGLAFVNLLWYTATQLGFGRPTTPSARSSTPAWSPPRCNVGDRRLASCSSPSSAPPATRSCPATTSWSGPPPGTGSRSTSAGSSSSPASTSSNTADDQHPAPRSSSPSPSSPACSPSGTGSPSAIAAAPLLLALSLRGRVPGWRCRSSAPSAPTTRWPPTPAEDDDRGRAVARAGRPAQPVAAHRRPGGGDRRRWVRRRPAAGRLRGAGRARRLRRAGWPRPGASTRRGRPA